MSSDSRKGMRRVLAAAGGTLATAEMAIAVNSGMDYIDYALTAVGAAVAAAKWWETRLRTGRERRRNPYWVLWKLKGGGSTPIEFRSPRLGAGMAPPGMKRSDSDAPSHWLAPPTGGWNVPTVMKAEA